MSQSILICEDIVERDLCYVSQLVDFFQSFSNIPSNPTTFPMSGFLKALLK